MRDAAKRVQLHDGLKMKGIDIAFVQETHSTHAVLWKKEWDGQICLALTRSSVFSAGVAILFSGNFLPGSFNVNK